MSRQSASQRSALAPYATKSPHWQDWKVQLCVALWVWAVAAWLGLFA